MAPCMEHSNSLRVQVVDGVSSFGGVVDELGQFGEIMRLEKVRCSNGSAEALLVSYFDVRAAVAAKGALGDRCSYDSAYGERALPMAVVKQAGYRCATSSEVAGITTTPLKGLVVEFFDLRVAEKVAENAREAGAKKQESPRTEDADSAKCSELSHEDETCSDSVPPEQLVVEESQRSEDAVSVESTESPHQDETCSESVAAECTVAPPPGLEHLVAPPPGLEHVGAAAAAAPQEQGDDMLPQDSSANAWADGFAMARAQANAYACSFGAWWNAEWDWEQTALSADAAVFTPAAVASAGRGMKPKPVCDIRLKHISCEGIKSNREHRTTLCMRPLPQELCQPGRVQEILRSAGLEAVVHKLQVGKGRKQVFGLAVVKAASPEEVPKILRLFHGRVWGNGRGTPPISVTFAAGEADDVKQESRLLSFKAEPRRITSLSTIATLDSLPSPATGTLESLPAAATSDDESTDANESTEASTSPAAESDDEQQLAMDAPRYVVVQ